MIVCLDVIDACHYADIAVRCVVTTVDELEVSSLWLFIIIEDDESRGRGFRASVSPFIHLVAVVCLT